MQSKDSLKRRNTLTEKKPSHPREGALQPTRRKAGLTSNGSEALRDKEAERDPQGETENDPQRGEGALETAWDHLSPSYDNGIHLDGSPPLTTTVSQVLHEVQHEKFLRWPSQMRTDPTKKENTRYCEFHKDHGHRTDDCIQLRKEIEYLIRRGYLRRYKASEGQDQAQPPPPRQPTPTQHQQPLGEIHVILGGFAGGGESSSARKAYLRSIRSGEVMEVQEKKCYL